MKSGHTHDEAMVPPLDIPVVQIEDETYACRRARQDHPAVALAHTARPELSKH